jgi:hypothetical protein
MATKKLQKTKGGNKKHGRSKKKVAAKGNPISLFIRCKIDANEYFKLTHQTGKLV